MSIPKYPDVVVPIWPKEYEPLMALGVVFEAMRKKGVSYAERHAFAIEAMKAAMDETAPEDFVTVCSKWVRIES